MPGSREEHGCERKRFEKRTESSAKRRRKQDPCCGHLNSLTAIKYAIVSLYVLVLLTIFGLCLAAVGLAVCLAPRSWASTHDGWKDKVSCTQGTGRPVGPQYWEAAETAGPWIISRSRVSSEHPEVLMENTTARTSDRSRQAQQQQQPRPPGEEPSTPADLLENIWKLENLFQNHSDWLQRLEILIKGLEAELRSAQTHSLQAEGYLVQLDDRLSSLSSSATRNLSGLIAEVSRTSTWLRDQDHLLRETSGQLGGLREKLEEVNWTVGAVNHTFSSDLSVHHQKIQDLQIQISNITEDTTNLWVTNMHTKAQLRNEMEILSVVTEDLRLKEWEHSTFLKNLTILEGPPGPKGEKGDGGDLGFPGHPGFTGMRGFPGEKGNLGSRGLKGFPGEKGNLGSRGLKGSVGVNGSLGEKGNMGPVGPKGLLLLIQIF
ncbi:hypothetical protein CRUP_012164 [Coryphaenoides rupestris]|nr:hypothetical protein CRUP_012164 [Coryphaenoides rupestris]